MAKTSKRHLETVKQVVDCLYQVADPEVVIMKKEKFNITAPNSIGVTQKQLNTIASETCKSNSLALELFDQPIYESKLLCAKIFNPKQVEKAIAKKWMDYFVNWEICDSFSMGQFSRSNLAEELIFSSEKEKDEFRRRTSFATIASYTRNNKEANNSTFEQFFPLIIHAATDERTYVKKAVDWALRSIGKRNTDLHKEAIQVAKELSSSENSTAKWIGKTSIKELQNPKVHIVNYPRSIYSKNE